jgi:hypothetical protein
MSYPLQSSPISLNGINGNSPEDPYIIENLSFEALYRADGQPISLEDCSNILIRNIDTRRCTMGLVYALNCTSIQLEWCRVENVAYEFRGQIMDQDFVNENDTNFYQFDKCDGVRGNDIKGRYGNTEDVGSFYQSHDCIAERMHWQGAIELDQPTSDGAESVMWTSESGTGHILGDDGGTDSSVRDSTFLDAGQVILQIAGGDNLTFDNCVAYGTGNTPQPWNTGATTWNGTPPMTNLAVTNTRIQYFKSDGSSNPNWWDPSAAPPDTTGSVFGDDSLVRSDYIVTL